MNYDALLQSIVDLHQKALERAALPVNRSLVLRNWLIGAYVVEFEQGGADCDAYRAGLLAGLSRHLRWRDIKSVSPDGLERTRSLYSRYPQLRARIPSTLPRKVSVPIEFPQAGTSATVWRESGAPIPTALPAERMLHLSWSHLLELGWMTHRDARSTKTNTWRRSSRWSGRRGHCKQQPVGREEKN